MLFIDAHNIRQGGGKILLDYLEQELIQRKIPHEIYRSEHYDRSNKMRGRISLDLTAFWKRTRAVQEAIKRLQPETVLCFGNFPPDVKLSNTVVYTYFHSPMLVEKFSLKGFSLKSALILELKRRYLDRTIHNTDYVLLQTETIRKRFLKKFPILPEHCLLMPFYDEQKIVRAREEAARTTQKIPGTFAYPSGPQGHKNHANLLAAWEMLLERNITPKLYLTVPKRPDSLKILARIEELNTRGTDIVNLKGLPHQELLNLMYSCEYIIFPSFDETFGLGLIEGHLLDCKVLVSERPYYHPIIEPSATFDPMIPQDIAHTVEEALNTDLPATKAIVKNQIGELLALLSDKQQV